MSEEGVARRRRLPVWLDSVVLLGVALLLAVVVKTFLVQSFYIPSPSMEPGLVKNDRILVQKPSYWLGGGPERGDVVVFKDPDGWLHGDEPAPTGIARMLSYLGLYPSGNHLVKRVIGTEGDVIECCDDDGRIMVNGTSVDETAYVAAPDAPCVARFDGGCSWSIGPVPDGKLFVMGDNRDNSADSRAHMCRPDDSGCDESPWVDEDLVVGKVFALVWPSDRWDWIGTPDAFDAVPSP